MSVVSLNQNLKGRGKKTYGHAGGGSIGSGFALVTDQNVNMGQELFKLNLEELGDKGGRQVEGDDLALGGGVLGDFERTLDAVGEKVAFDVKVLGAVDERGDLGLGEVGRGELLGGTEGGAEGTVVAGKNDGTGARLGGGRLDLVGRDDALGFVGLLEGVFEVVVADGADVGDRLGGVDVLCRVSAAGVKSFSWTYRGGTGGVLGGTTGDVGDVGVGDDVVVAGGVSGTAGGERRTWACGSPRRGWRRWA